MIEKLLKSDIVSEAASEERDKAARKSARETDGKKMARVKVAKLIDAEWAGTRRSEQTSLFVTEGDSARSFAVSGLGILGHEKFGVFPLKGKPLNVREASAAQISGNAEITALKQVLGLKDGDPHTGGKGLRYGSLIILTDADHDGAHIRGLILNFLHVKWPALAASGFVKILPTPIVRATKGAAVSDFYSLGRLREWVDTPAAKDASMKYFKVRISVFVYIILEKYITCYALQGLGTWAPADAKKLLAEARAVVVNGDDGADDAMELAFGKKKEDARKEWILANVTDPPEPDYLAAAGPRLAPTRGTKKARRKGDDSDSDADDENAPKRAGITISDFVNKDLVNYSIYSNQRALPSVVDGFKTGHRKVIFTVFQRKYLNVDKEIKVAQLGGAVAEKTLYLHGEASLMGTIVNMAQDFAGACFFLLSRRGSGLGGCKGGRAGPPAWQLKAAFGSHAGRTQFPPATPLPLRGAFLKRRLRRDVY
jgi:DNA topoisomerase-2